MAVNDPVRFIRPGRGGVPAIAKGGKALAEKMTSEERKAKSMAMVEAKKIRQSLPNATHGSSDKPLRKGAPQCAFLLKHSAS